MTGMLEGAHIFPSSIRQWITFVVPLELLSAPYSRLTKTFKGQEHIHEVWSQLTGQVDDRLDNLSSLQSYLLHMTHLICDGACVDKVSWTVLEKTGWAEEVVRERMTAGLHQWQQAWAKWWQERQCWWDGEMHHRRFHLRNGVAIHSVLEQEEMTHFTYGWRGIGRIPHAALCKIFPVPLTFLWVSTLLTFISIHAFSLIPPFFYLFFHVFTISNKDC